MGRTFLITTECLGDQMHWRAECQVRATVGPIVSSPLLPTEVVAAQYVLQEYLAQEDERGLREGRRAGE